MSRDLQMIGDRQAWIGRAKAVGIDQILSARGTKLAGRSPALAGPCPHCGGKDRFSVHFGKQVFNCRGCGTVIESEDWLSEWTAGFVGGLLRRSSLDGLTGKQTACINRIIRQAYDRGVRVLRAA